MFWAMLMANRHHYRTAYLDVFNSLYYFHDANRDYRLSSMDSTSRDIALAYLRKGAALGDSQAMHILSRVNW
jgi:hypothetical protein